MPSDWRQTTLNPQITVTSGVDVSGMNLGAFQLVTLSGTVFDDVNDAGVENSKDPTLSGWTVNLDASNNGSLQELSATTDAAGNYSFPDLGPGTYTVSLAVPSGWQQTTANPAPVTVTSGRNVSGNNFGAFQLVTLEMVAVDRLRQGNHSSRPVIVLQFSGALNAADASDMDNYSLSMVRRAKKQHNKLVHIHRQHARDPSKSHREKKPQNQGLALSGASYSASNDTVTLFTVKKAALIQPLQLTVNGGGLDLLGYSTGGSLVVKLSTGCMKVTRVESPDAAMGLSASAVDALLEMDFLTKRPRAGVVNPRDGSLPLNHPAQDLPCNRLNRFYRRSVLDYVKCSG